MAVRTYVNGNGSAHALAHAQAAEAVNKTPPVQDLVKEALWSLKTPDVTNREVLAEIRRKYPGYRMNENTLSAACAKFRKLLYGRGKDEPAPAAQPNQPTSRPVARPAQPSQAPQTNIVSLLADLEECRQTCGADKLLRTLDALDKLNAGEVGRQMLALYRKSIRKP